MRFLSVFVTSTVVIGCILSAACSVKPACDSSVETIATPLRKIIESDNAKNLEGVLACYSDDITFVPPSGDVVKGKSSIRARYEKLFATFNPELTSETSEVISSGDIAYVRGYTRGKLNPVAGGEPTKLEDKFLAILRCTGGTWQVSHLMWSPVAQTP